MQHIRVEEVASSCMCVVYYYHYYYVMATHTQYVHFGWSLLTQADLVVVKPKDSGQQKCAGGKYPGTTFECQCPSGQIAHLFYESVQKIEHFEKGFF